MISDYFTIVEEKILRIIGSRRFLVGCSHYLKIIGIKFKILDCF